MKGLLFSREINKHRLLVRQAKPKFSVARDVSLKSLPEDRITLYIPNFLRYHTYKPTIIFITGTGFVARETSVTDVICSNISKSSRSQVICLHHALAPEVHFPELQNDAFNILRNVIENNDKYKIDFNRISIMGYSSGGNLAVLLSGRASELGIEFLQQVLISPCLDLSRGIKKFRDLENKDTAINEGFVTWFLNHYLPDEVNRANPMASPVWASNDFLRKQPPTDIVVSTRDRFLGDSREYADRLYSAGVGCSKYEIDGNHGLIWENVIISKFIGRRCREVFLLSEPAKELPNMDQLFVLELIKSYTNSKGIILKDQRFKLDKKEFRDFMSWFYSLISKDVDTNGSRITYGQGQRAICY